MRKPLTQKDELRIVLLLKSMDHGHILGFKCALLRTKAVDHCLTVREELERPSVGLWDNLNGIYFLRGSNSRDDLSRLCSCLGPCGPCIGLLRQCNDTERQNVFVELIMLYRRIRVQYRIPSASELRSGLEKGSDETKIDTLRKIIVSTINGNTQVSHILVFIIRYTDQYNHSQR